MKKTLSFMLAVIISISAFTVVAFAENQAGGMRPIENSASEEFVSPRMACSWCSSPMKLFKREFVSNIPCTRYPFESGKTDKKYAYYYECNYCGSLDVYEDTICTH